MATEYKIAMSLVLMAACGKTPLGIVVEGVEAGHSGGIHIRPGGGGVAGNSALPAGGVDGTGNGGGADFDVGGTAGEAPDGSVGVVAPWERYIPASDGDRVSAVAVDRNGNVYIGGSVFVTAPGSTFGNEEASIRKLHPDGSDDWSMHWGGDWNQQIRAIAVDRNGNVLVAGETVRAEDPDRGTEVFLLQVNPAGKLVSTTYWGGPGNDYVRGLRVLGDGSAIVVGSTYRVDRKFEAFAIKVSANRVVDWEVVWGNLSADDAVYDVALSGSDVVVGGVLGGDDGPRMFIARIEAAGKLAWTRTFGTTDSDSFCCLDVEANGSILAIGSTIRTNGAWERDMFRFDQEGTTLERMPLSLKEKIEVLVAGADGDFFVGGTADGGSRSALFVARVANDGTVRWMRRLESKKRDGFADLATDDRDGVFVVGLAEGVGDVSFRGVTVVRLRASDGAVGP